MTTAGLTSFASPRVPQASGMLSCLGGFSPRIPTSAILGGCVSTLASPGPSYAFSSPRGIDDDLLHLEHDPKLAAKIMRKRQQDADRCNSRLTPRMQRIGLDIAALNVQVAEKKVQGEDMQRLDQQQFEDMRFKGELVKQGEALVQADRRQQQTDCMNFSLQHLKKEQRREWYLSDPQQLKTDRPARMDGFTPALSSMQKFEGEQGVCPAMKKEKRQEQVNWLMAQMAEKKTREEAEKDRDRDHDAALLQANSVRTVCAIAGMQEHRAEVLETAKANEHMAICRSARQKSWREREMAAKKEHMANAVEHNVMREKYDYAIGLNGKKRDYKRCSYEEEVQAWETNRVLVQAKKDRERGEVDADGEYRQIGAAVQKVGDLNEAVWHQKSMHHRQAYDTANMLLAQEKKDKESKEKEEYASFAASPNDPLPTFSRRPDAST